MLSGDEKQGLTGRLQQALRNEMTSLIEQARSTPSPTRPGSKNKTMRSNVQPRPKTISKPMSCTSNLASTPLFFRSFRAHVFACALVDRHPPRQPPATPPSPPSRGRRRRCPAPRSLRGGHRPDAAPRPAAAWLCWRGRSSASVGSAQLRLPPRCALGRPPQKNGEKKPRDAQTLPKEN